MKILVQIRTDEIVDMIKVIGINLWVHRYQIKRAIEDMQNETLILNDFTSDFECPTCEDRFLLPQRLDST